MDSAPITWEQPATFDISKPGLGLPELDEASHQIIYDPKPSIANTDEGGDGVYESLIHGTFCHGPRFVVVGDHIVVAFTNHTRDEGGPGERHIGRVGRITDGGEDIDWGGYERFVATAPQPIAAYRRKFEADPEKFGPYSGASLIAVDDRIYVRSALSATIGFTNEEQYRHVDGPVPEENFADNMDLESGFYFDKWAVLKFSGIQQWKIEDDRLVPTSPMYERVPFRSRFEVTPGRYKESVPLLPPYSTAVPFNNAPADIKADIEKLDAAARAVKPMFREGERHLSADGKHALAHLAEYKRPDGSLVVVRDNLQNPGHFYASERASEDEFYPPGQETNLCGGANPAAGQLPDGRPYIIYNEFDNYYHAAERSRKHMLISVSEDGRRFDKTWLLKHVEGEPDGGIYKYGGPQYFSEVILGNNMWIFYSITKQQIGLTKVPLSALV